MLAYCVEIVVDAFVKLRFKHFFKCLGVLLVIGVNKSPVCVVEH